jgi:gamma-glutamylcyclotransferase (GGCT)/AIG2-like uncharacterized protein YtfP
MALASRIAYFAYGANMDANLLVQRTRSSTTAGLRRRLATLNDYRLTFDKEASGDLDVGYANVAFAPGLQVEGILNDLAPDELALLDAIESVPDHYIRKELVVRDNRSGKNEAAQVYVANPRLVRSNLCPSRSYLKHLFAGADLLSPDYVARLRAIASKD